MRRPDFPLIVNDATHTAQMVGYMVIHFLSSGCRFDTSFRERRAFQRQYVPITNID